MQSPRQTNRAARPGYMVESGNGKKQDNRPLGLLGGYWCCPAQGDRFSRLPGRLEAPGGEEVIRASEYPCHYLPRMFERVLIACDEECMFCTEPPARL